MSWEQKRLKRLHLESGLALLATRVSHDKDFFRVQQTLRGWSPSWNQLVRLESDLVMFTLLSCTFWCGLWVWNDEIPQSSPFSIASAVLKTTKILDKILQVCSCRSRTSHSNSVGTDCGFSRALPKEEIHQLSCARARVLHKVARVFVLTTV